MTLLGIQEDAGGGLAAAKRREMEDNFQLGEPGAVKSVSDPFWAAGSSVRGTGSRCNLKLAAP